MRTTAVSWPTDTTVASYQRPARPHACHSVSQGLPEAERQPLRMVYGGAAAAALRTVGGGDGRDVNAWAPLGGVGPDVRPDLCELHL